MTTRKTIIPLILLLFGVVAPQAVAQDDQSKAGMKAYSEGLKLENDETKYAEALAKYQQSCDLGFEKGCDAVALFYGYGIGTEVDLLKARPLAEAGCERGNGSLCVMLGVEYARGEAWPADFDKSVDYMKKGCLYDNPYSCRHLSLGYRNGAVLPKDPDLEYQYGIKACQFRDDDEFFKSICDRVTEMGEKNIPSINYKDPEIYKPLCDLRIPRYCFDLGASYAEGSDIYPQSFAKANIYFEMACDKDYEKACANLGVAYLNGTRGKAKDATKAATYLAKACSLDDYIGCSELGLLHETGPARYKDYDLAIAYYEKACNLDSGRACYLLGSAYYTGRHLGRSEDLSKAALYAKRGCKADRNEDACRLSKKIADYNDRAKERALIAQQEARLRDDAERARQAQEMGRAQSFVSGLYDTQTSPSQKRVCANIYQGGRMTYECMTQEHFDRYFKP